MLVSVRRAGERRDVLQAVSPSPFRALSALLSMGISNTAQAAPPNPHGKPTGLRALRAELATRRKFHGAGNLEMSKTGFKTVWRKTGLEAPGRLPARLLGTWEPRPSQESWSLGTGSWLHGRDPPGETHPGMFSGVNSTAKYFAFQQTSRFQLKPFCRKILHPLERRACLCARPTQQMGQ